MHPTSTHARPLAWAIKKTLPDASNVRVRPLRRELHDFSSIGKSADMSVLSMEKRELHSFSSINKSADMSVFRGMKRGSY